MKLINPIACLGLSLLFFWSCDNTTFTPDRKTVKLNDVYYPAITPMNEDNEDEIMGKMNNCNGLYQVYPKPEDGGDLKNGIVYQVRTYDISTMSIIKGKKGWIIIDPLNNVEAARKGWEIFKANIDPDAKLRAVIISHSHVDHYMGLTGVVNPSDILRTTQEKYADQMLDGGKVLVVAPNGFYEEAISENLYLGNSMERRASYMYGMHLPVDECGGVGAGLGKNVSFSSGSLIEPTFELKANDNKIAHLNIDGLSVTFLDTPNTEAPAEFHIFFNDQVIRLMNKGMNMEEIAEMFHLPAALGSEYYNRGYYGTLNHNVKAAKSLLSHLSKNSRRTSMKI